MKKIYQAVNLNSALENDDDMSSGFILDSFCATLKKKYQNVFTKPQRMKQKG